MADTLYSRREWLALAAAVPLSLGLAACTPIVDRTGRYYLDGTPVPDATNNATPATGYGDTLTTYEGTTLDAVGAAKIQRVNGIPTIAPAAYRFAVSGNVDRELSLTYDQILALPSSRKLVTLPCVEGWSAVHVWDGVRIGELLNQTGYDTAATTLIFHCLEGYSTALPLKDVLDEGVLLAWAVNGITLPEEYGYPLRAVAQHRLGYKWAKWIEGIEVSNDTGYQGYWEQRGYDNGAGTLR